MNLLATTAVWWPGTVVMIALVAASAFFSGSETAFFYLSRDEVRRFSVGRPRQRLVAALLRDPDRLLSAILFWNLVVNLLYFAVSLVVAQRVSTATEQPAAAGAFSLVSLLGIILFGEVLPKSLAVVFRRPLAAAVSWPLAAAVRLLDAVMPSLRTITLLVRRTFWPHIGHEPYLDTEDLERAVESSDLSAELIRQERQVLHNILDLSEITVEEAMRPRGTYLAMRPPVHLADLGGEVPPGDYLVIVGEDEDDIRGAVALASFSALPQEHLEQAAEDVVFVPWCAHLAYTLEQLRVQLCSLAVVVNEYGDTLGVLTYEDILETFLSPEPSRAKRLLRREPILEIAPDRYHVEGITTLRYLCRKLGMEYEPTPDGQITVAGLLYDQLERIPEVGDECTWRGLRMKVIDVSRRGQLRVMVERAATASPASS